ncbi:MAG: S41 family peptidase [Methylococcaceae bacterium]
MRNSLLIIFLMFWNVAISQENKVVDWNSDINFIKDELPKNHYNLYMVKTEQDFLKGLDQIAKQQNQLSNFEVAIKLQQLIASLGDLHTSLALNSFLDPNKLLPLGLMWFSDGIWVQFTTKDNEAILGSKLLKINDFPIQQVVDSLSTLTTIDNQATVKKTIPKMIPVLQVLECFGFSSSDSVQLQLESNGKIINTIIHPEKTERNNLMRVIPDPIPLCYQNERAFFWQSIQKKENVYYIQYNKCYSRENPPPAFRGDVQQLPSFNEFSDTLINTISRNNFDKIIFDIRFNGGGNSALGTELIKRLSAVEKANKKGKLYVITGRETFSSAIINAMDFKKKTNAILVGEETSGKPNHLGEIKFLKLPSSGVSLAYSTNYFKTTENNLKSIVPDQIIEQSFADFKEGRDPVYEWIVKQ